MSTRFSYIKYDEDSSAKQQRFKKAFEDLETLVAANLKGSRPTALCLTALEEAYMWVGKSIRDEQIERKGLKGEQEERGE